MYHFLTLAAQVLLERFKITDEASCRTFLSEFISLIRSRAAETKVQLNPVLMRHVEFILNNNALFTYIYRKISEQLQTPEVLFESADEEGIIGLVGDVASNNPKSAKAIDPVVIISLVSQIISVINAIKTRRNR